MWLISLWCWVFPTRRPDRVEGGSDLAIGGYEPMIPRALTNSHVWWEPAPGPRCRHCVGRGAGSAPDGADTRPAVPGRWLVRAVQVRLYRTGRPKGVINAHCGIAWMQDTYRITRDDRVLYKTPVSFDAAMWEWLWQLSAGARIVVADVGAQHDPVAIASTIRVHSVTVTHFIPSMLRLFTAQPEARECHTLR